MNRAVDGVPGGEITPRLEHIELASSYLSLVVMPCPGCLVGAAEGRTSSGAPDCLGYTGAVWTSAGSAPVPVGPG
jgi:hypothetical protein